MIEPAILVSRDELLRSEVWDRLSRVTDPELDESVTEMGFVTDVRIRNGNEVHIAFRLPTYWCSPNFAFMMGHDMRSAVLNLEWVEQVNVVLAEHLCVEEINRGVNEGLSFEDTFGDQANGNLEDLRQTFLEKAFQWRQEVLIAHLMSTGKTAETILSWSIGDLVSNTLVGEARFLADRYLDRRTVPGPYDAASLAFVTLDGSPLKAETLKEHLRAIRRLRTNAEFNGALCRRLLVERFGTEQTAN